MVRMTGPDTELKRLPVKMIRDFIKKHYIKSDVCYICNKKDGDDGSPLELHHLYTLSELFHTWCRKNKITDITQVDTIKELRIQFEQDNQEALDNKNLVTLCKTHHIRLHSIYGQTYANVMVPKIRNWLEIQKQKVLGVINGS